MGDYCRPAIGAPHFPATRERTSVCELPSLFGLSELLGAARWPEGRGSGSGSPRLSLPRSDEARAAHSVALRSLRLPGEETMRYAIAGALCGGEAGGDRTALIRPSCCGMSIAGPYGRLPGGLTKLEVPNALRILFLWFYPY